MKTSSQLRFPLLRYIQVFFYQVEETNQHRLHLGCIQGTLSVYNSLLSCPPSCSPLFPYSIEKKGRQHLKFWVWLVWDSMMFPSSTHWSVDDVTPLLSQLCNIACVYRTYFLFSCLFVGTVAGWVCDISEQCSDTYQQLWLEKKLSFSLRDWMK